MISERPYFRTSKLSIAIIFVFAVASGIVIFATELSSGLKVLVAAIPVAVAFIVGVLDRLFRERLYKDLEEKYSTNHQIDSIRESIQTRDRSGGSQHPWGPSDQEADEFIQDTLRKKR